LKNRSAKKAAYIQGWRSRGFTLVELLIAFTLIGLITLLLFSSLRLGLRAWEGVESTADANADLRIARNFLARALRQARPVSLTLDGESVLVFSGDAQTLELVAPLSEYVGVPGLYILRLSLDHGERERLVMTRWLLHPDVLAGSAEIPEWRPLDGGLQPSLDSEEDRDIAEGVFGTTILAESVDELRFDYFGPLDAVTSMTPAAEVDAVWQEDWMQRRTPPLAVRIRLTTAERPWPDMQIQLAAGSER
jgi:general secretion pathway protein J